MEINNSQHHEKDILLFKIVQSGKNVAIPLTDKNLRSRFREIYQTLLKDLRLKQKDVYISNEEGRMIGISDLNLSLQDIIKKFGTILKLYYEKII